MAADSSYAEPVPELEFDQADLTLPALGPGRLWAAARSMPRGVRRAVGSMVAPTERGMPTLCPTPYALGAVVFEEAALAALGLADRLAPGHRILPSLRDVDRAADVLERAGYLADPAQLFPEPPVPRHVRRQRRQWNGMNFGHTSFPSSYAPPAGLPRRDEYLADEANRTVHMYVLRHDDKPRPYVVVLHPHQSGEVRDVFLFGSAVLFFGLGVNVVHPVLPLHGKRRTESSWSFPSPDALTNLYAATQAIHDVRSVLHLLRQRGATELAVHGYSLGGYTASLLAGVADGLDAVIAGAAPTDFFDVTLRHERERVPRHDDVIERLLAGGSAALSTAISPLTFAPRLPRHRRFIFAAVGDVMVHPEGPLALQRHWDDCELTWLQESHLTGMLSPAAQQFIWRSLRRSGVTARPPRR